MSGAVLRVSLLAIAGCWVCACGRVGVHEIVLPTSVDGGDAGLPDAGGPRDSATTLGPCPNPPAAVGGMLLIDDVEDGNGDISERDGRGGAWYTVNDGSSTGMQVPAPRQRVTPVMGGAQNSNFAVRMWGSGFSVWGAALGVPLSERGMTQCAYDARDALGIRFYAKGSGTVTISVASSATVPESEGGTCTARCFDYHAIRKQLSADWASYQIAWSELRQSGWGAATNFSPGEIMYLEFAFGVNVSFDVYLDDLAFY